MDRLTEISEEIEKIEKRLDELYAELDAMPGIEDLDENYNITSSITPHC